MQPAKRMRHKQIDSAFAMLVLVCLQSGASLMSCTIQGAVDGLHSSELVEPVHAY